MRHNKFEYVKTIVDSGMATLLLGEAGSGKSTLCMQIAEATDRQFSALALTKQTAVNAIIGFISINGTYIPSQFRKAYEEGHLFLLDELDAADANVLLIFNTLENGYMAFPDGIVHAHKNFRLVATANPQDGHSIYTGRSKLDFSTMNRFYKVNLERDPDLEETLTSPETAIEAELVREFLRSQGSSIQVTMRDTIRIHDLKKLGLDEYPVIEAVFQSDTNLGDVYKEQAKEQEAKVAERKAQEKREQQTQHETETFDDFSEKVMKGK